MKVKICGLTRPDDASAAEALGASYVGAVVVPGSPRRVSPERARTISRAVGIPLVLVVADLTAADAGAAAETAGARVIQLHGDEPAEVLRTLRGRGPWELWKAVRVRSRGDILDALESYGDLADVLLLDGWHRSALGGTGTLFPWEVLESLRGRIPSRLRLAAAGGLSPENVAEAVARLRPDIVDVSSGVETSPGVKDPERLRRFVERALADEGGTAPNANEPT